MCFNPAISLSTALVEFILASIILIKYRKTAVTISSAIIIYIAGIYQFTEFMLCTSSSPFLWAMAGFITYSILPALGLHASLVIANRPKYAYLAYIVPALFAIFALTTPKFIISASCNSIFVTVTTALFSASSSPLQFLLSALYWTYYLGFILAACLVLIHLGRSKDKKTRKVYTLFVIGVLLMSFPTFLLMVILPSFAIRFPSILCHFALLLAILFFWASSLDQRR